jgi:hypothetical protein
MGAWFDRESASRRGRVSPDRLPGTGLGLGALCGTTDSFSLARRHAGDVGDAWRCLLLGAPPSVA